MYDWNAYSWQHKLQMMEMCAVANDFNKRKTCAAFRSLFHENSGINLFEVRKLYEQSVSKPEVQVMAKDMMINLMQTLKDELDDSIESRDIDRMHAIINHQMNLIGKLMPQQKNGGGVNILLGQNNFGGDVQSLLNLERNLHDKGLIDRPIAANLLQNTGNGHIIEQTVDVEAAPKTTRGEELAS